MLIPLSAKLNKILNTTMYCLFLCIIYLLLNTVHVIDMIVKSKK